MAERRHKKRAVTKRMDGGQVWADSDWAVHSGRLVPGPGRPRKSTSLFRHVGEKLPYASLSAVEQAFKAADWDHNGVYIAHDSMGFARYVGRGNVFDRLRVRQRNHPLELHYFSFYIITSNNHEREIETLMIRLGGAHLHYNSRKKRIDTSAANVGDYEPGTRFMERQHRRGRPRGGEDVSDA